MKTTISFKRFAATMLMSLCGMFTITSCQDDAIEPENNNADVTRSGDQKLKEAYGLSFENFVTENDVQILNADTTEISINKALAEKLGITSFKDHPIGIWDKKSHLPYARKAMEEKIVGDRFILKVKPATVAEMIGDKSVTLNTSFYVNNNAQEGKTRAGMAMPAYAAKFMDESDVIHPAVVLKTDPYGYDKAYHDADEAPAMGTRATGEFQFIDAEDMVSDGTRASVRRNVLSIHEELKYNKELKNGGASAKLDFKAPTDFELNYFLVLNGGVKWHFIVPEPYVKKFETGLDGNFSFKPELKLTFKDKIELPKDKQKYNLVNFTGYTFVFWVGVVPVYITCNPNLYMKLDGKVDMAAEMGFKYEYENTFKGGVSYQDGRGWSLIREFNEKKNEFTPNWPKCKISANAGIGLYFGVDVMLYGTVGPKVAVGPHIGAKAEGTFKSDLSGISGDFKASIDMSAKAEAGVKLKILGYEVAEWSNNFDLVGPWTLWKFPVDGSIHKSPLAQKADEARALIDKACSSTEASQARIELVDMMAQMQGKTHDEAETKLAEILTKQAEGTADEQQKLQKMADFIKAQRDELKPKYTQWIKEKNWNEIAAMILANKDVIENRAKNGSFYNSEKALETAHERFVKAHNREPEQNNSDLEELMKTTINYREGIYDDAVRMVLQDSQVKQLIAAEETWTKVHMEDLRDIFQKGFSNKKQADEQYVSRLKSALLKDFRTKFSHLPWEK